MAQSVKTVIAAVLIAFFTSGTGTALINLWSDARIRQEINQADKQIQQEMDRRSERIKVTHQQLWRFMGDLCNVLILVRKELRVHNPDFQFPHANTVEECLERTREKYDLQP